jgi:hypothetical protein
LLKLWSVGVLGFLKDLSAFPLLHCSSTPVLQNR